MVVRMNSARPWMSVPGGRRSAPAVRHPPMARVQPVKFWASSEAQIAYPWCAHYGGREGGGGVSCGSVTYAQCMATVSGQQGFCDRNPFYQGLAVPAPSARERRSQR